MNKELEQSEFISKVICDLGRLTIETANIQRQNIQLKDKLYEVRRNLRAYLERYNG